MGTKYKWSNLSEHKKHLGGLFKMQIPKLFFSEFNPKNLEWGPGFISCMCLVQIICRPNVNKQPSKVKVSNWVIKRIYERSLVLPLTCSVSLGKSLYSSELRILISKQARQISSSQDHWENNITGAESLWHNSWHIEGTQKIGETISFSFWRWCF